MRVLCTLCLILALPGLTRGQKFAKQIYLLSDHFSKETCEVDAACDCCASELIFLNKKQFALIDRCLHNDTYLRGTYETKGNDLTLNFRPVVISQLYEEKTQNENHEKKRLAMTPLVLQIRPCGQDKVTLGHPTIREYKYGSRRKGVNEKEIIRQLKKSKAWKLTSS